MSFATFSVINTIPFLVKSSRNIRFSMVESLPNCQVGTITTCLKKVIQLYHHRGFHITSITCDPEFEALGPYFPMLNCCVAGEHVPEIESPEGSYPKCVQHPPIQELAMGSTDTSSQELHPLAKCIPSCRWGVQCAFPAFSPYRLGVVF